MSARDWSFVGTIAGAYRTRLFNHYAKKWSKWLKGKYEFGVYLCEGVYQAETRCSGSLGNPVWQGSNVEEVIESVRNYFASGLMLGSIKPCETEVVSHDYRPAQQGDQPVGQSPTLRPSQEEQFWELYASVGGCTIEAAGGLVSAAQYRPDLADALR
ncbi:MAG: hypothetical protein HY005_02125 [Candidatus Staskawiczbacteria bacterium]|nr:hypothetical protein [Candidatus Staskawiczbacteria bacterium]